MSITSQIQGSRGRTTGSQWYLLLLTLAVVYLLTPKVFGILQEKLIYRVVSRWQGDTLRFNAIRGLLEIAYLQGKSGSTIAVARLRKPLFIVDSETVTISYAEMQQLEWRTEGGSTVSPPVVGSPIQALYQRFEVSDAAVRENEQK